MNKEIGVMYGDQGLEITKKLLHKYNVSEKIDLQDARVGIKPNLVLPSPAKDGATTDPRIVAGIIEYVLSFDPAEIIIMESSWVGAETSRAFEVCGYRKLAEKYGVDLIDLKGKPAQTLSTGNSQFKVFEQVQQVDVLINVPVLKAHCQTEITCALKNMKGCIPDAEKRRFHREGLHQPIAGLNQVIDQDLIIVDGIFGDLTFEEGGNPVKMNRVMVGTEPLLVDMFASRLLGLVPEEIGYIKQAVYNVTGKRELPETKITEYNTPVGEHQPAKKYSSLADDLAEKYVKSHSACSACYGSLIQALYRLNKEGKIDSDEKICIGQGYRNKSCSGVGIGNCTSNFEHYVSGCPPEAKKIVSYFRDRN